MPGLNVTPELVAMVTSAIKAIALLVAAFVATRLVRRMVPKIMLEHLPRINEESLGLLKQRSATISGVITQVASAVIWIVAILMALSVVSVNVTPVLATVGIPALAIGFAAQNIIRDYFHGFFIVMEDWYRVGEVVQVAGVGGLVEEVSLRRTVLRDLSGTLHIIPNSKIEMASNLTRDWARVNLNVPVAYKEDLDHVFQVINEVCQELKDDPEWGEDLLSTPRVERVDNLGDSAVEIKVLGDTKPMRQWALTGELRKRLKVRFDKESIEIPWPHTMVYFGGQPTAEVHRLVEGLTAQGEVRDDYQSPVASRAEPSR